MGSVYRAEPLAGGPVVALKLVRLDARDPRALKRFEREVESGRRIESPFVARALEAGALDDGLRWVTMELAEGQDLGELVQRRELSRAEAQQVLAQLFAAVAAAHDVGLVHRDLKPENVRVSADLRVKVLDFGIVRDFGIDTFSGTTPGLGTPLWTAPEQARQGSRPVPAADVWALGLLTFFTLTGALYWRNAGERASMAELALELLKGELVPPSARAAELGQPEDALPRGFDAWFARAVVRDPSERFPSAREAWAALEPLFASASATATREPPATRGSERASLVVRPGAFVTLVIASVVLACLVIFWLVRSMHI